MARCDLPDVARALLLLNTPPGHSRRAGHPYTEHRKDINGMFRVLCSGAPWHDLPERYGSWKTVYNRFNRWSKIGGINIIFNRLLTVLAAQGLVNGSAVASGWQQYPCPAMCCAGKHRGRTVLADKAYAGHVLRSELKKKGFKAAIPRE